MSTLGTVEWKHGCHSFGGLLGSQLVSSVAMSEDFKFTQFIVFLFARCLLSEFFFYGFKHCNVSPSKGKCLRRSVNSSTPALSIWKLPQVLQQQQTYKWTLSFYRHRPPCFKFENNTSGRARLWDTALKFLAEAFSWRHQITWLIYLSLTSYGKW